MSTTYPTVWFFEEGIQYTLRGKEKIRKWIKNVIEEEGFSIVGETNFIFCSDEYLLKINKEYLNHDTYTDIITFDSSESDDEIAGDIFISIERVRENAKKFKCKIGDELHRVMVHGVLHLCGYDDLTVDDKREMTDKENYYLGLLS